jgi:hypothetical protein
MPPPEPGSGLALRPSVELSHLPGATAPEPAHPIELQPGGPGIPIPPVNPPAPVAATAPPAPSPAAPPPAAAEAESPSLMAANAQTSIDLPPSLQGQRAHASTWMIGSLALLAAVGYVVERRRRRLLEMEKDSVLWANVQPAGASIITTAGSLDDILPDSPDPAEAARAIYVTAIGETNSRREATLIDLHQLHGKLTRRRQRGDNVAAVLLLQQHLVDFRYTSPWVFLELRELYKVLDRQNDWEVARDAFRKRFGQNAPVWAAPSNEEAELIDDPQLCVEISHYWPFREARMLVLRWMLGEPDMRQRGSGPPLLPLGVYRDLMLLDTILDGVMIARPQPADSLL